MAPGIHLGRVGMGGIGIVNNPRSRRNRRDPRLGERLRARLGDAGEVIDAATPDELDRAVERFRARGVDVLGIGGGDGTAHVVLSAFADAYGDAPLPQILLLRAGAMNTVAHGNAIRGSPEAILRAVLARRQQGIPLATVERDLLRVEADGIATRHGFIFGTGAVVAFLEAYYATGRPSPLTAGLLLARSVGSALVRGPFAASLTRRDPLRVWSDGEEWSDARYLALVAGSTPDIGFGFRAFHRCSEQPGSFHAVGVTASPLQIALALPRIRAGRPWKRRHAQDEVARELRVEGDGLRFTVDGDLYGPARAVRISTGPGVELVVP
ncbi:diacylglycerol/lipid kinase family protein [Anaeromyxobacter dehalogenans]|nr:diacylglycerol kinase family protein [Anaeromyxobacter dehalogenans]